MTTHIFDPDDPYIDSDAVFGVKKSLIATFNKVNEAERIKAVGLSGEYYWDVEFDFVLAPKRLDYGETLYHLRCHHRITAAQGNESGSADHRGRAGRKHPSGF